MSESLRNRAEQLKLARLLSVEVDTLPDLDGVPSEQLAELRERVTDRLFDESARALGRVGAAARLVPTPVVATIAHKAFGPLLCARAASAVDPGKAIDVAKRLPADFLADVTIELDPRRVADIIAGVPVSLVVPVAEELGRREEHVTMGRFLAFVSDEAVVAAMGALSDEAMLRTAFVLEHKDRLDHAVGLLPPGRVPGVLRLASQLGLWAEALDLLEHLGDERRGPIADVLASLDPEVVDDLVATASEHDLWASLLPVVRVMSPEARTTVATLPAFHEPAVLTAIVDAAARLGLWADLLPLVAALPPDVRSLVPPIVSALDPELLATVVPRALADPTTVRVLRELVEELDDEGRVLVSDLLRAAGAV